MIWVFWNTSPLMGIFDAVWGEVIYCSVICAAWSCRKGKVTKKKKKVTMLGLYSRWTKCLYHWLGKRERESKRVAPRIWQVDRDTEAHVRHKGSRVSQSVMGLWGVKGEGWSGDPCHAGWGMSSEVNGRVCGSSVTDRKEMWIDSTWSDEE